MKRALLLAIVVLLALLLTNTGRSKKGSNCLVNERNPHRLEDARGKLTYLAQVTVDVEGAASSGRRTRSRPTTRRSPRRSSSGSCASSRRRTTTSPCPRRPRSRRVAGDLRRVPPELVPAREAEGIASHADEARWLDYAGRKLDKLPLAAVRPAHVRAVLAEAMEDK